MNALARSSMRRGACPGLSAPMQTGDGLLARLTPSGATILLPAFRGLCAAARRHGNGVIEITSRGSIQVRGLNAASAAPFAAEIAALGIAASDGIPVMPDPLTSFAGNCAVDVQPIVDDLRNALAASPFASRLSAKVSVIVDGGSALHLDDVSADVRLCACDVAGRTRFHVALGGTAASAIPMGAVAANRATECVMRLLEALATAAPDARMHAAIGLAGMDRFSAAIAGIAESARPPASRQAAEPIGVHSLRAGRVAVGVTPSFGHCDAETLQGLIEAAGEVDAAGIRTAPGRALLVVGIPANAAENFTGRAKGLGFIVDPDDPRRRVIACAGSPICASGEIPARTLAPAVAEAVGAADIPGPVHVSGCAKGCAYPHPAPIAIVGRDGACDIQIDGKLVTSAAVHALPQRLGPLLTEGTRR